MLDAWVDAKAEAKPDAIAKADVTDIKAEAWVGCFLFHLHFYVDVEAWGVVDVPSSIFVYLYYYYGRKKKRLYC